jgi:tRNA-dihydrouridine synthase B
MKFCSILLTIDRYTLKSRVFLAPMAGVSDTPFRRICQSYGAGLTTSEMLTANSELWGKAKSRLRSVSTGSTSVPHSVQIVGSEPGLMAEAAQKSVANGADIIDINMGCPAKKVCNKAAGSALLKDEQLVADILVAIKKAVDVPVTLKIRTGWDANNKNAVTIAKIAQDCGIAALTVHGRTRACRFNGSAEFDTIAAVKQAVGIPVIANGDITSPAKALAVLQYTQADGIMIGRGAQGQPWIFRQIIQAINGQPFDEPAPAEKQQCLIDHISALHHFYGEYLGIRMARKHAAWYFENLDCPQNRKNFNSLETVSSQLSFLHQLHHSTTPEGIAA